jgi:drug/metabolite transporter (DMT)-like permease
MPMPAKPAHNHPSLAGTCLLVLSAVAFSTAGFFTRQAPVDLWAMVFWRNFFGTVALAVLLFAWRSPLRRRGNFGPRQLAVVGFGAFGTITYLAAFKYTSVAHIAVIYATAPLITAAAAWIWRRERMAGGTMLACLAALLGVGLTVAPSLGAGTLVGDGLALAMTVSLSLMAVAARGNPLSPLGTAFATALAAILLVLPLGWLEGANFAIGGRDALWLAAFGLITMAIALPCYLVGAARVPAVRSMLISALEMPLAPLWVWLACSEAPSAATLAGGAIVALAILGELASIGWHKVWRARRDETVIKEYRHPWATIARNADIADATP